MLRAPSHGQPLLLAPPSPRFQVICVQLCPFTCPDGTALRAGTDPPPMLLGHDSRAPLLGWDNPGAPDTPAVLTCVSCLTAGVLEHPPRHALPSRVCPRT